MTVKGQIVIPAKIRHQLGLTEGTRIQIEVEASGQRIVLTPITREYIQSLRGKYRGKGLLKSLAVEKRRERVFQASKARANRSATSCKRVSDSLANTSRR